MFILYCSKLFLQNWQPVSYQMNIFKTKPLPFFSCIPHKIQSSLILPAPHRKLDIILPLYLSLTILFQLFWWIIASWYNKQRWNLWTRLILCHISYGQTITTYVCYSEGLADKVYQRNLKFLWSKDHYD